MTDTSPTPNTLTSQMEALEAELLALNEKRAELFRQSLEQAEADKLVPDVVANAMLAGPLSSTNAIDWPVELHGIAWAEGDEPILNIGKDQGWAVVRQGEFEHLGIHVGSVAAAVEARMGGPLLHLSHTSHMPLLYVPYLGRIIAGASWRPITGMPDLERFAPPEAAEHDDPWYRRAHIDVSSYVLAKALADSKAKTDGLKVH